MLTDIHFDLTSITNFFDTVYDSASDFFNAIPQFLGYISDLLGGVPTCLAGFCGIALSLLLANKILNLI